MKMLFLAIVLSLVSVASTAAQVSPGDQILTFGGGVSTANLNYSGTAVDGGMVGLSYDQLAPGRTTSFAFTFGYSQMDISEDNESGESISRSVATWPFALGARGWLGKSKIQGYAGALLAVYFSSVKVNNNTTGDSYNSLATSGWGLQVPLGIVVNLSQSVILSGGYTLNWLWSNDAVENDLIHSFVFGLGFKLN